MAVDRTLKVAVGSYLCRTELTSYVLKNDDVVERKGQRVEDLGRHKYIYIVHALTDRMVKPFFSTQPDITSENKCVCRRKNKTMKVRPTEFQSRIETILDYYFTTPSQCSL